MKLSKQGDLSRKWRSFKRHVVLLAQPIALALFATYLWQKLHTAGIHFPKADEASLTTAVIATLAIAFSILAGLVLNSIWEKYQKVVICVLKRDMDCFLLYRDERIPIVFHLLLASLSLPIIVMVMLLEYSSVWSGGASTFVVTLAISVYWLVATQLQNPAKSLWFAERIPPDWLTVDIDEHFKLHQA